MEHIAFKHCFVFEMASAANTMCIYTCVHCVIIGPWKNDICLFYSEQRTSLLEVFAIDNVLIN